VSRNNLISYTQIRDFWIGVRVSVSLCPGPTPRLPGRVPVSRMAPVSESGAAVESANIEVGRPVSTTAYAPSDGSEERVHPSAPTRERSRCGVERSPVPRNRGKTPPSCRTGQGKVILPAPCTGTNAPCLSRRSAHLSGPCGRWSAANDRHLHLREGTCLSHKILERMPKTSG
jgi:hypothetical protein